MKYSKNYNIPKPDPTDNYDITVIGQLVDGVDTAVKIAEDASAQEIARQYQEDQRVSAENFRISAENSRTTEFDGWRAIIAQGGSGSESNNVESVKKFGAKGDGVTDDTAAINSALSSANKFTYVPPGVYMVSTAINIPSDKVLIGAGFSSIIKLVNNAGDINVIQSYNTSNVSVENILIDGNKDGQSNKAAHTTCVQVHAANNFRIKNAKVINSLIEGIYLYNSTDVDVSNVICDSNGYFQQDASGLHLDSCTGGNVCNVISKNNGFHGVISSSSVKINYSNILSHDNGWDGFRIQYDSNDNNFSNIQSYKNFRGIYFLTNSNDNLLTNCVFRECSGNGINLNSSIGNSFVNVKAIGNTGYGLLTVLATDNAYAFGLDLRGNVGGTSYLEPGSSIMPIPATIT